MLQTADVPVHLRLDAAATGPASTRESLGRSDVREAAPKPHQ